MSATVNRPLNTCRECRRKKLGCDRARPSCTRCQKNGTQCTYEQQSDSETRYTFVEQSAAPPQALVDQHDQTITIPVEQLNSLEARVDKLCALVRQLKYDRDQVPEGECTEFGSDAEPGHLSADNEGNVRYVDKTFWACICKEASELDSLLLNSIRTESNGSSTFESDPIWALPQVSHYETGSTLVTGLNHDDVHGIFDHTLPSTAIYPSDDLTSTAFHAWEAPFGGPTDLTPEVFIGPGNANRLPEYALPSVQQVRHLLKVYFEGYHVIVPLVHQPNFSADCHRLLHSEYPVVTPKNRELITLMLAACFAAAIVCPEKRLRLHFPEKSKELVAKELHKLASRFLKDAGFPFRPSLRSLTAYILCQSTWLREDEPLTSSTFVGLGLKAAHTLGLHKDPSHFPQFDPIEAEVRRRVWWQLVHIDVLLTTSSGLPPMIEASAWDVQQLSELKDEYIGTPEGLEYESAVAAGRRDKDSADDPVRGETSSMVSAQAILVQGKLYSSFVMRRALIKLLSSRVPNTEDIRSLRLMFRTNHQDLVSRIHRIPQHNNSNRSCTPHVECQVRLNKFTRYLLSTFIDRNWSMSILVFHPLTSQGLLSIWPEIYEQAVYHCKALLMKVAYISSNTSFELFHWSWPGNHQPLHAMIIVLHFLIDHPSAQAADECRRAVDFILALHEKSHGLVAGAQRPAPTRPVSQEASESWALLFRLRTRAWAAAGLDPEVLWTRQEAASLCLREMEDQVTDEHILERFQMDDPAQNRHAAQVSQMEAQRDMMQARIDALLSGGDDRGFEGLLW